MRITVRIILLPQQRLARAQFLQHGFVRVTLAVLFENGLADHAGGHLLGDGQFVGVGKRAVVIHGRINRQAVLASQIVVVQTVAGGDVNKTRAGVAGDELGGEQFASAIAKGVLVFHRRQLPGRQRRFRVILPAAFLRHGRQQSAKHNIVFFADARLDIRKLLVVSDGQIRGEGPGSRRPNHEERAGPAHHRKFHINALADVVVIFHLGFGQRGAAGDAPIHRLFAAIHEPPGHEVGKQAKLVRFVFLVERQVGILPIAQNAQALELRALKINVFARVSFAGPADVHRPGRRLARLAHVLRHLELDGQAMTVPAGNVGRAEPAQGFVLDDDVLENFVQSRANMDVAVGEGRPVVQDKFERAGATGLDLPVKLAAFPLPEPRRFALDQIRLHGEVCPRQIQRVFIIRRHQSLLIMAGADGVMRARRKAV